MSFILTKPKTQVVMGDIRVQMSEEALLESQYAELIHLQNKSQASLTKYETRRMNELATNNKLIAYSVRRYR